MLWLALWPGGVAVSGETAEIGPEGTVTEETVVQETERLSLLQSQGPGVLVPLAIPVVLAAVGALAVHGRRRVLMWTCVALLWAFSLLGAASIGLFYKPAALALLVVAALRTTHPVPEDGVT
jgi:hypothetical protein